MKLILASGSERRQELLKRITKHFDIIISDFDENSIFFNGVCEEYVMDISIGKALNVREYCSGDSVIIASDTVVFLENRVLGKPENKKTAIEMLSLLSGKVHQVYTGLVLLHTRTGRILKDYVKTDVEFSELDKNDIINYVETGEPMDKAGAYGIQGFGGVFVKQIHGCYYNVMGLPLNKLKDMLREMGVNL